jgi:TIR domain
MGHIFISYSRRDTEVVDRITEKLQKAGISIWIDRERIEAGQLWRKQIVAAIDASDAVVLMLSTSSAVSDNVRKEIDLAESSGCPLFIMKLDSVVELPAHMRYQLAGLQSIELQKLGFDDAVHQLIEILKEQPKAPEAQPVRQVELVFKGLNASEFGAEKRKQLLNLISEVTETPRSQIQSVNLTPAYASVGMPSEAAIALKTSALNEDIRLEQFGLESLRLEGDNKSVSVQAIGSTKSHLLPGDPTTDAPPPKGVKK